MKNNLYLIKNAIAGDNRAIEELLRQTEKEIISSLYFIPNDNIDLYDIVQDVLIKIQKNIKKLKNPKSYKSWVSKITMNKYYDYVRKNKKLKNKNFENICDCKDDIKDEKNSPIEKCMNDEALYALKKGLCSIKEQYRNALIMREFGGLSYNEISKITKTEIGTVKSRISRARKYLKEEIKNLME